MVGGLSLNQHAACFCIVRQAGFLLKKAPTRAASEPPCTSNSKLKPLQVQGWWVRIYSHLCTCSSSFCDSGSPGLRPLFILPVLVIGGTCGSLNSMTLLSWEMELVTASGPQPAGWGWEWLLHLEGFSEYCALWGF